ncbi:hypothetical protein AB0M12_41730 [Nocardia vinacea]|uniref:hypothetical protein n=1 Tax=Nocardia vinacea TaxID=96468 RepID=UPI003444E268
MGQPQQAQICGCGCGQPGAWRGMCKPSYDRSRYRRQAYGRWPASKVSADTARSHLQQLEAAGVNRNQVAKLAGLGASTLSRIAHPDWQNIRPDVEAAILSIEIPERAADITAANALVPVTGARRRIQALIANGHQINHLAEQLGIDDGGHPMSALIGRPDSDGRIGKYVTASREREVKQLFDRLQMTPGSSEQARAYARERGWPLPLEWDEDDIDRPDAKPIPSRRTAWKDELSRREEQREQRVERDERVLRLLAHHSAAEVAQEVGITQRSVERIKARSREETEEVMADEIDDEEETEVMELTEDEW